MPHWPARLLLKLFAQPSVAIGGAAPTAQALLPADSMARRSWWGSLARARGSRLPRAGLARGQATRRRLAS